MNIEALIKQGRALLRPYSESFVLDVELLLSHILGVSRSYLYAYPEQTCLPDKARQYHHLVQQRIQGVPIAYLVGYKDFWNLRLKVNESTLIPRCDTETLVEVILKQLVNQNNEYQVLDLGTGSGAIALSLASEWQHATVLATDISEHALTVAADNAAHNQITNVSFLLSDWFDALPNAQRFDVIVSNPPYVAYDDRQLEHQVFLYEPQKALFAGDEGLEALKLIIDQARRYLNNGAWLGLEHGHDQSIQVQQLLSKYGYNDIQSHLDLHGLYRVTCARYYHCNN